MKDQVIIDKDKLAEIIKYSNDEISTRSEGVSKDTIASHIAEKMKEILKDDNREN